MSRRWSALVRHGLVGGSLLAASTAAATPCDDTGTDKIVGVTIGFDFAPKFSLVGGIEARACTSSETEVMARIEIGGGRPRIIGGARISPLAGDGPQEGVELLGLEAGVGLDLDARLGVHLAAVYGTTVAYAAAQTYVPISNPVGAPPAQQRGSLIVGLSPWSWLESTTVEGRPLTIDGRMVHPEIIRHGTLGRSAEDRAVAAHFERSARAEYSSVWSFLRLAAELDAVGAPAQLVAAALDAAEDEVRHAEACARAAGELALIPLPPSAAQPRFLSRSPRALELLATEAYAEGALNEGAASLEAHFAAETAQDETKSMLAAIARDEAGHASLAWAVLTWVMDVAPDSARAAVASVPTPTTSIVLAHRDAALARRGVPSRAAVLAARDQAFTHAVLRARALVTA